MSTENFLLPVARIIQGNLYEGSDKDADGNPRVYTEGEKKGQPKVQWFIRLAVPKTGESHWAQTPWGAKIWTAAHAAWPQLIDRAQNAITLPTFAWKISDGDSTLPNKKMRKNCDIEGAPGHWLISLTSGYPFKVVDAQGYPLPGEGLVKTGFYVEALINVRTNNSAQSPGIHINAVGVAYRAPGKEITSGPDLRQAGFGAGALPPGVSAAPPSSGASGAYPPAGLPAGGAGSLGVPAVPSACVPVPVPGGIGGPLPPPAGAPYPTAGSAPTFPSSPPPLPVAPAPGILYPAAVPPLTAKAGAHTYQQMIASGWTDALLRQEGYLA